MILFQVLILVFQIAFIAFCAPDYSNSIQEKSLKIAGCGTEVPVSGLRGTSEMLSHTVLLTDKGRN